MYHLNRQLKYSILVSGIVLIELFFSIDSAQSGNVESDTGYREKCVKILYEGLDSDVPFWVSVHAAENLLWNGYFDGVKENFIAREDTAGAINRIGVWRVLARANKKDQVAYYRYVNHIRETFCDTEAPDRLHAIETLAKLGFAERLPEIVAAARGNEDTFTAYARWVLANSGIPEDEASLAELLTSDNSKLYARAGYALRFLDTVQPETYVLMEECAARFSHDTEGRVYIVSALYVHAPEDKKEDAKRNLLTYAAGKKNERYEVLEALGYSGDISDTAFIKSMLDDPDMDVRVSAANALLRIERRQHRGLKWPDWFIIGGYAFFMVGIGFYYLHRQKNTEDYLLGGRKINPVFSGISLFATMISTISYLALPGEIIKHGPTYFLLYMASLPLIYLIVSWFFIPLFMKLRIVSAYEILEKPFGVGVRLFGSIIFIITRLAWMALLIFLTTKALVVMMNWDASLIPVITIIIGFITLLYSSMGGLRAVIVTDVAQFTLLLIGSVLTISFVSLNMGGVMEWFPTAWAPTWDSFKIFSTDPHIRVTVVGVMLTATAWWVCTAGSDQMAIQRYLATRDTKAARRAFLCTNFAEAAISILLSLTGFALFGFFRVNPHLIADGKSIIEDADFLFPHYIANFLPIGIAGLVVAGILSAAMSSLSSGINSTATVIMSDFFARFKKKKDTEFHNVKVARFISIIIGVIAVLLSTVMGRVSGNIMEITNKTNGIFVAPLFNLFFMALFIPFATPLGTVFGSIYGIFIGFLIAFWDALTGGPGLSFLLILPLSLISSIVFGILFSLLPTKGKRFGVQLIWSFILLIPLVIIFILLP